MSFAFSFAQEDIDHVLRLGGNNDNSRMRVAAEYMKQKPLDEIAAFLSREYVGGAGLKTESGEMTAWFTADGIRLAKGRTAQYSNSAQVIPWTDAAARIGELLEQGQFATNVELAETLGYTRSQLAQSLWYLRHDFSESAIEQGYLSSMEGFRGNGFPEETAMLAERLSNPEYLIATTQELEKFVGAYGESRDLMRFHYHHTAELLNGLRELSQPWRDYATVMAEVPKLESFITEDEISAALTYGSSVEGSKGRIYGYFSEKHTPKEQVAFLKDEYGWGGHNNALPGSFRSQENHSGKGIELKKPDCTNVELSWSMVAKRISELVRKERYLTPKEKTRYLENEALKAVPSSYTEYAALKEQHPDDLVLYQIGHFYEIYDDDAKAAASFLDSTTDFRTVPDGGNRSVFRVPDNQLTEYVNHLREQFDLTISGIDAQNRTRQVYSLLSIDHEAEAAINAHEAENGADGTRTFPDNAPEPVTVPSYEDYSRIKQETQTGILLYQVGDFFEMYGEDAEIAAEALDINLTSRALSSSERTPMCVIPGHRLEQYVEKLQDAGHNVVISGKDEISGERRVFRLDRPTAPIAEKDASARLDALRKRGRFTELIATYEQVFDVPSNERVVSWYGDYHLWEIKHGTPDEKVVEAFDKGLAALGISEDAYFENSEYTYRGNIITDMCTRNGIPIPQYILDQQPKAPEAVKEPEQAAPLRSVTQADIDAALQRWNGDPASKRRVQEYMEAHAREKDTADWLSREYGGTATKSLFITVTGTDLETELTWPKVQRRIAQLIKDNRFLSEQEALPPRYQVVVYHHFENGFDEKLDYQSLQEAEKAARGYLDGTLEADGFAYEGAAIYDLQEKQYVRVFGDYPDPTAHADTIEADIDEDYSIFQAQPDRNDLAADLDLTDTDLQDALTGDGGLLDYRGKDAVGGWFRDGESNAAVAQKLGDAYAGTAETMTLLSGETADYFASTNGIAINIHDKFNTNLSFGWNEVTPVLRAMYQQERDGFTHEPTLRQPEPMQPAFPYAVGDTVYLENGKAFIVEDVTDMHIQLRDPTLLYPIWRSESRESFERLVARYPQPEKPAPQAEQSEMTTETVAVYPADKNNLPYDIVIERLRTGEPEHTPPTPAAENFRITDDDLGVGGAKAKFRANLDAINLLKELEHEGRQATPDEQEVLSRYVGWGGLADAFDESKQNWASEFKELSATLTPEEYNAARASTLNAHYTSPTVIRAIYDAVENIGFQTGNILEIKVA